MTPEEKRVIEAAKEWRDAKDVDFLSAAVTSGLIDAVDGLKKKKTLAPGHNPDGLTVEQVGEGWRLLSEKEIVQRGEEWMGVSSPDIQLWRRGVWRFGNCRDTTAACSKTYTYRTQKPEGYFLQKEESEISVPPFAFMPQHKETKPTYKEGDVLVCDVDISFNHALRYIKGKEYQVETVSNGDAYISDEHRITNNTAAFIGHFHLKPADLEKPEVLVEVDTKGQLEILNTTMNRVAERNLNDSMKRGESSGDFMLTVFQQAFDTADPETRKRIVFDSMRDEYLREWAKKLIEKNTYFIGFIQQYILGGNFSPTINMNSEGDEAVKRIKEFSRTQIQLLQAQINELQQALYEGEGKS